MPIIMVALLLVPVLSTMLWMILSRYCQRDRCLPCDQQDLEQSISYTDDTRGIGETTQKQYETFMNQVRRNSVEAVTGLLNKLGESKRRIDLQECRVQDEEKGLASEAGIWECIAAELHGRSTDVEIKLGASSSLSGQEPAPSRRRPSQFGLHRGEEEYEVAQLDV